MKSKHKIGVDMITIPKTILRHNEVYYNKPSKKNMIEKFVEVEGGKVYCRMEGSSSEEIPLVILHGGPGYPSYYLENLEVLKKQQI